MSAKRHSVRYVADDGRAIVVIVPWGFHSGLIPPPLITFGNVAFAYDGMYASEESGAPTSTRETQE